MTQQHSPDFNAELQRQRCATESAQQLADQNEAVIKRQRDQIDRLCESNIKLWSALERELGKIEALTLALDEQAPPRVSSNQAEETLRDQLEQERDVTACAIADVIDDLQKETQELRASAALAVERYRRAEAIRGAAVRDLTIANETIDILREALKDIQTGAEQQSQSHADVLAKCRAALLGARDGRGERDGQ